MHVNLGVSLVDLNKYEAHIISEKENCVRYCNMVTED